MSTLRILAVTAVALAMAQPPSLAQVGTSGPFLGSNGVAWPTLPEELSAPEWDGAFGVEPGVGKYPGLVSVKVAAVFDDGGGPMLYVGGDFHTAGGKPARHIARWDGNEWSALGTGLNGEPRSMLVHDDGSGPALYVGGSFSEADGVTALFLARWDGASFSAVGSGLDGAVWTMTEWFNPGGAVLVLGGDFTTAGGAPAAHVASWNGSTYSTLGSGFDDRVEALSSVGPALFAGGQFTFSGVSPVAYVAQWSGGSWSAVGGGTNASVSALEMYDPGTGTRLYVGGNFTTVGATPLSAERIASWDFANWSALGVGIDSPVEDLVVWDDGGGADLYVAHFAESDIERWDGASWSSIEGLSATPFVLVVHDDGAGESLWAGGWFTVAGGKGADRVARWDGSEWHPTTVGGLNARVHALCSSLVGGGPTLYVGGVFYAPGQVGEYGMAAWKDGNWVSLGWTEGPVFALIEHNEGSGPAIYAGGIFNDLDGMQGVARWNGAAWSPLDEGISGPVWALASHNDGTGKALYAAGSFTSVPGLTFVARVVRWDGSAWSNVGTGIPGTSSTDVRDLAVYDDGTGPALYATGDFLTSSGAPGNGIARWDGSSWSAVGTGLGGSSPEGFALEVYDDGTGPQLYVGGDFDDAGGVPDTDNIARWDGTTWSAVGGGLMNTDIESLELYHDGTGPGLYAGGSFIDAGTTVGLVARYDASGSWSALGNDIGTLPFSFFKAGVVGALAAHDDGTGSGPQLVAGGLFTYVEDTLPDGASYLVRWGGAWDGVDNWVDLGFPLAGMFGNPLLVGSGSLAPDAYNLISLSNTAPSALAGLFYSVTSTPVPFEGGTLVPIPGPPPILVTTSPVGTVPLPFLTPDGLPPGLELYLQWAINDAAAVSGTALSNAVRGDVP